MKLDNLTPTVISRPAALDKRRYGDACGTAHGLELIGDRWALLVLRELMLGGRRFSDLRSDLPGISANVLAQRLGELEERGLVRRKRLPPPAAVQVYEATEWGLEAEPIIQAIGRWAARSPSHDPTLPISAVSIMLSFRTMISKKRAKGFDARIGLRLEANQFVARLRKGGLTVVRGSTGDCDAIFSGTPSTLAAVVYANRPLDLMGITGDRAVAERFVQLFVLPPKVGQD